MRLPSVGRSLPHTVTPLQSIYVYFHLVYFTGVTMNSDKATELEEIAKPSSPGSVGQHRGARGKESREESVKGL